MRHRHGARECQIDRTRMDAGPASFVTQMAVMTVITIQTMRAKQEIGKKQQGPSMFIQIQHKISVANVAYVDYDL